MQKISLKKTLKYQTDKHIDLIYQFAKTKIKFYDDIIDKLVNNESLCDKNELECLFYTSHDIEPYDKKEFNNFPHPIKNKQLCNIYEEQLNKVAVTDSKYSDIHFSIDSSDSHGKFCVYAHVNRKVIDLLF